MDETIERTQWDFFWVPPNVTVVDRPELLYVRCAQDRKLYNQVTRTRADAARLPALVAEVVEAHAGVSSRWLVPATIPRAPLEKELEAAGYAPAAEHHACAIAVDDYRPRPTTGITARPVEHMEGLCAWLEVADRTFGGFHDVSADDRLRQLGECTGPTPRVHRFVAYDDATHEPLAIGGLSLYPTLSFGFLWAGATIPEARGRGAYSTVLEARLIRARQRGLTHVGLYAVTDTSFPVVHRQGFTQYGPMTFWDRPGGREPGSPPPTSQ